MGTILPPYMSTKVSKSTGYGPNRQMSVFGYLVAAILIVVMLPLLPILVLVWLLWRAFTSSEEPEHSFEQWRRES